MILIGLGLSSAQLAKAKTSSGAAACSEQKVD